MILEISAALIIAGAFRPQSKEDGWIRVGNEISAPLMPATQSSFIAKSNTTEAASASYMTEGAFMLSRLDWLTEELQAYSGLESGWDGPDSQLPATEHIDAAISLAGLLPAGLPLPKPMLSASGSVGLYWETDQWIADIEIENANAYSLYIRKADRSDERYFDELLLSDRTRPELREAFSFLFA